MSSGDLLAQLAQLRAEGRISDAEFERLAMEAVRAAAGGREGSASPSGDPAPSAPAPTGARPSGERSAPLREAGPWVLLEHVGAGGMGEVYRARHRVSGEDAAVKLVHPHLARDAAFVERLRREFDALRRVDHPGIVRALGLEEVNGQLALALSWVPGRPLSQVIGRETGPIPWERARGMAEQLCAAVEHAHGRGVIHRDLKPANVHVTPEGRLVVLDFGVARTVDGPGHTRTGTGLGTVDYMAPEQYTAARDVGARADVYALGMTLYESLAGRLPWEPHTTEYEVLRAKTERAFPPPTQFYPAIPPWVEAAVMDALQPDPETRVQSASELWQRLAAPPAAVKPVRAPNAP